MIITNPSLVGQQAYNESYLKTLKQGTEKLSDFLSNGLFGQQPKLAVVLGSGLGGLANDLEAPQSLEFTELGLPVAGAQGHAGRFVVGKLEGEPVLLQQGRIHMYEGHPGPLVALPIRMMMNAGVRDILITNAAGALDPKVNIGDLVLNTSFHFQLPPAYHPSTGLSGEMIGSQFYPPAFGYSEEMMEKIKERAKEIPLHEGGYVFRFGPNYEDPSDIRDLSLKRSAFLDIGEIKNAPLVVGMSTVPEILAVAQFNSQYQGAIKCCSISNVTNLGAGLSSIQPSHQEVLENSALGGKRLREIICGFLG